MIALEFVMKAGDAIWNTRNSELFQNIRFKLAAPKVQVWLQWAPVGAACVGRLSDVSLPLIVTLPDMQPGELPIDAGLPLNTSYDLAVSNSRRRVPGESILLYRCTSSPCSGRQRKIIAIESDGRIVLLNDSVALGLKGEAKTMADGDDIMMQLFSFVAERMRAQRDENDESDEESDQQGEVNDGEDDDGASSGPSVQDPIELVDVEFDVEPPMPPGVSAPGPSVPHGHGGEAPGPSVFVAPMFHEDTRGNIFVPGRAAAVGRITSWGTSVSASCFIHGSRCRRPYSFHQLPRASILAEWLVLGLNPAITSWEMHFGLPKPTRTNP